MFGNAPLKGQWIATMRSPKTVSIAIPISEVRKVERLARSENLTVEQVIAQALESYVQLRRPKKPETLLQALKLVRDDAARKGTNKMTMREINQEIAAYRREVRNRRNRQAS